MTLNGLLQIGIYIVLLLALAKPLGTYMARVYEGEPTLLSPRLRAVRAAHLSAHRHEAGAEMGWKRYAVAMLLFNLLGLLAAYAIQRAAGHPAAQSAGPRRRLARPGLQHRGQLHHQHQLAGLRRREHDELPHPDGGLAVHNFISAATGIAIAIALTRGLARRSASAIGNFWVDLTRATLYILLPLSLVLALVLVCRASRRTFSDYVDATTLEGGRHRLIAHGPMASQESDQGARHERRRLLQRQLGPPLREPDPAD